MAPTTRSQSQGNVKKSECSKVETMKVVRVRSEKKLPISSNNSKKMQKTGSSASMRSSLGAMMNFTFQQSANVGRYEKGSAMYDCQQLFLARKRK